MDELVRGNFLRNRACPLVGIVRRVGQHVAEQHVMHHMQQHTGQFVGRRVEHEVGVMEQ